MPLWAGVWMSKHLCLTIPVLLTAVSNISILIHSLFYFSYFFDEGDMTGGEDGTLVVKTLHEVKEGDELYVCFLFQTCIIISFTEEDIVC